jgi:hypothetical protein
VQSLYATGGQLHANCTRVAASRMQISVDFIHNACDWRPRRYNLHATGGHSGTINMQLAASRMQTLHALAASCMQSHQFFASTLQKQLFGLKNEDVIKKSEDLRNTCACAYLMLYVCCTSLFLNFFISVRGFFAFFGPDPEPN